MFESQKMTPEQESEHDKDLKLHPNGGISWVNSKLLDKNSNFDSTKLDKLDNDDCLPF